jgi:hypothetical protein
LRETTLQPTTLLLLQMLKTLLLQTIHLLRLMLRV